jgi:branched-chain amino acid transport system permease protein
MAENRTTKKKGPAGWILLTGLVIILALAPVLVKSVYILHVAILVFIYVIATASLRTIALSGQLSLGHAGFMSIGAYISAILAMELSWTPWITMPLGAIATLVVAVLVGFPFSRLRTFYFSMVSLFFGMGILAVNTAFGDYTGGYYGLAGIPALFLGQSKVPYYFFFLGLAVVSLFILHRFEHCRIGMSIKAIAQSYEVAASVGINVAGYRVLALAAGCFITGLAGAGYAHYNQVLSQTTFDVVASVYLVIYMIVGGIGSFAGPIIGAVILTVIPELFRGLKMLTPYAFAIIVILVIFFIPQGIIGIYEQAIKWFKRDEHTEVGMNHDS